MGLRRLAPKTATHVSPQTASPQLLSFMEHFIDAPATIVGPALDVPAANALSAALYSGFARQDNLLRMMFLDPAAPAFSMDWERAARGVVSNLRTACAPFADDPRITEVIGELHLRYQGFFVLDAPGHQGDRGLRGVGVAVVGAGEQTGGSELSQGRGEDVGGRAQGECRGVYGEADDVRRGASQYGGARGEVREEPGQRPPFES
ncbi:hypothetical protein [Streptomyces sioyaensis]|uniref:MmyB family transcriptional regulator n=1 Tax=Streptomyces sioyaensis TaxID=67364 RepID=UPI0037B168AB